MSEFTKAELKFLECLQTPPGKIRVTLYNREADKNYDVLISEWEYAQLKEMAALHQVSMSDLAAEARRQRAQSCVDFHVPKDVEKELRRRGLVVDAENRVITFNCKGRKVLTELIGKELKSRPRKGTKPPHRGKG